MSIIDYLLERLNIRPKEIQCECGHTSKLKKEVNVNGEKTTLRINYKPGKKVPYCLDCVEKMHITCPWCGRPIYVGDYITLYTPKNPNFVIPKGSVVYSENPLQLVGCQRRDCADTGADYCGIWEAPGVVKRFPSAIELCIASGGKGVIASF